MAKKKGVTKQIKDGEALYAKGQIFSTALELSFLESLLGNLSKKQVGGLFAGVLFSSIFRIFSPGPYDSPIAFTNFQAPLDLPRRAALAAGPNEFEVGGEIPVTASEVSIGELGADVDTATINHYASLLAAAESSDVSNILKDFERMKAEEDAEDFEDFEDFERMKAEEDAEVTAYQRLRFAAEYPGYPEYKEFLTHTVRFEAAAEAAAEAQRRATYDKELENSAHTSPVPKADSEEMRVITESIKSCIDNIQVPEKTMEHGWIYRIAEAIVKAVFFLLAGLGMVLGSLVGQGLAKSEHRQRFASIFFTLNQTDDSEVKSPEVSQYVK